MQEPWVRSLGREDPLEEEMATHPSILAWRIPRTKEPGAGAGRGQGGRMHPAARPAAVQVTASSSIPTTLFQIPYLLKGNER